MISLGYINNFDKNKEVETILISGNQDTIAPLVCILIPTFNRDFLLKETILSALNQIDFTDFEIIVVDNNPDRNCNTEKIINEINNTKVIYYKNTRNIGMFGNWNRGFELSRSKWTILLHDDDIISQFYLSTCSPLLSMNNISLIKPNLEKFSDIKDLSFTKTNSFQLSRYYFFDFLIGCKIGAPTCILYKTIDLIEMGGFNQDYFPCSDFLSSAIISKTKKIYKIDCTLGGYRISENESLNDNSIYLYHHNRILISSSIMNYYRFPKFLISKIHSSLFNSNLRSFNSFYNVEKKYNYQKLHKIPKANFLIKFFVKIAYYLIYIKFLDLYRFKKKYKI